MTYLITITTILVFLAAWLMVQAVARWYAGRHPHLGLVREEGAGCGSSCGCAKGQCSNKQRSVQEVSHE